MGKNRNFNKMDEVNEIPVTETTEEVAVAEPVIEETAPVVEEPVKEEPKKEEVKIEKVETKPAKSEAAPIKRRTATL